MGCISSKFLAATTADFDLDPRHVSAHHVVSLTSTTYGALNLDRSRDKPPRPQQIQPEGKGEEKEKKELPDVIPKAAKAISPHPKKRVLSEEPQEIINTWELMKDLSDEAAVTIWSPAMKPAANFHTPEFSNSPKKQRRRLLGKENNSPGENGNQNPTRVLRPFSSSANRQTPSRLAVDAKGRKLEKEGGDNAGSRRCLSPLFDPQLVSSSERESNKEEEQIKRTTSAKPTSQKARESRILLEIYESKCPPGGENALIFYSTTLRGIRKTFEDCNAVRDAVEAYDVKVIERDISMDSGFREELRVLMGRKDVRPPLVFVKGRLIGGAEEVLRLEEEGKLGSLFEGLPKREAEGCRGCGGMRFVMCRGCNGSCKVLDVGEKKTVKCGECNENGLVHCNLCC